jgi:tetratricopeptide (TPR) repeat protein
MLFVVLARFFGMPVRGVLVPTHAFVEMGSPGGKILEIETTSATGYDLVHDDRFYRESAANWSGARGLRPVTLEEYQHRRIVEPYRLMAAGMGQQAGRPTSSAADKARLLELAAFGDPDDSEWQYDRLATLIDEGNALRGAKASRTTAALFGCVEPAIAQVVAKYGSDAKIGGVAAWARAYYAEALMVEGRTDEATTIADDAIDRIDPAWQDATKLHDNFYGVLIDRMLLFMKDSHFDQAAAVAAKHLDGCRAYPVCAKDLQVVYRNGSIEAQRAGDWPGARRFLQQCVANLPDDAQCRSDLADLESRHQF